MANKSKMSLAKNPQVIGGVGIAAVVAAALIFLGRGCGADVETGTGQKGDEDAKNKPAQTQGDTKSVTVFVKADKCEYDGKVQDCPAVCTTLEGSLETSKLVKINRLEGHAGTVDGLWECLTEKGFKNKAYEPR